VVNPIGYKQLCLLYYRTLFRHWQQLENKRKNKRILVNESVVSIPILPSLSPILPTHLVTYSLIVFVSFPGALAAEIAEAAAVVVAVWEVLDMQSTGGT